MRIRRYLGKDAQEAMLKVKIDLGSEAIILSTRKVRRKGIAGFFRKPLTEVLAAVDEEYSDKKSLKKTSGSNNSYKADHTDYERENTTIYNDGSVMKRDVGSTFAPDHGAKGKATQNLITNDDNSNILNPDNGNRVNILENRVMQMEAMLERIMSNIDKSNGQSADAKKHDKERLKGQQAFVTALTNENDYTDNNDKAFAMLRKVLSDNEIEAVIIEKLLEKIKKFVKGSYNYQYISSIAERILKNVLGQPQTIQFREDGKPTTVLFLGPTGVGKTTTLAKIAANYSLNHKKKIGLITADTYRIAAVEQLKTYAEILNLPVSVIYTPDEIHEAILEHQDKELILIDTAGRSHKNAEQFSELKMLVAAAEADEVYLVLNSSMGPKACREILNHYSFLKEYKLLFTKLDEALVPGIIINVRYATGRPLSYTTAGQSVPDDIEVANTAQIVKSIFQNVSDG
jgi:flagellar biosynthesis protein FlhF